MKVDKVAMLGRDKKKVELKEEIIEQMRGNEREKEYPSEWI